MGLEQGSLSPKQGLENIHGYILDAFKVPYRDCLSGILALGGVKDKPAVAAFLEVVAASRIGDQVMSDLVVSDATLSVVPDHQKTKAEMAELLQVATILPLDREEKNKPYLYEFRKKYPLEPVEPVSPEGSPEGATGAEAEVKNLLQQRMQLSGFKEGETREESQERFKKILLIEKQLSEAIVGKEICEANSEIKEEYSKIRATTLSPYRQSSLLDDPQQAALLERLFQADSPEWAAAFSNYLEKYRLWVEDGRLFTGELEHQEGEAFGDFYGQRHSAFYRCLDGALARKYNAVKQPNWYLVNAAEPDFWEKAQAGQFQTIDEMREKLKGILESQMRELQLGIRQEEYLSEFYAILAQKAGLRIIPGQDNGRYAGLAEEQTP